MRVGKSEERGLIRVELNPFAVLFSENDFKSHFPLSGNFLPVGQIFSGQPLNVFANRFTEVGCGPGGEVVRGAPFGEDGRQERRRAAETTRTPRAST